MKKYFIPFLFAIANILQAQPYQSIFGANQTSWKITFVNLGIEETDSLYTVGDTVINNLTYKKIYTTLQQRILCYLREDSLNSKLFSIEWQDGIERLIMDLNAVVGDSFNFNIANNGFHTIDTIYYSSGRKILEFNNSSSRWNESFRFIEGVGPSMSFVYQAPTLNTEPYIICSYKDGTINYSTSNFNFAGCDLITNIHGPPIPVSDLKLFPNPVTDKFYYKNTLNINEVILINELGIICKTFSTLNYENGMFVFDVKDLHPGFYYVLLNDNINNRIITNKIIKY